MPSVSLKWFYKSSLIIITASATVCHSKYVVNSSILSPISHVEKVFHPKDCVTGVSSTLNSATVMPLIASSGANMAAG